MSLRILLLGASGRLGQKIVQKLLEHKIEFIPLSREHTTSYEAFTLLLDMVSHETKKYTVLLDVSLPTVTHTVANVLLKFLHDAANSHNISTSHIIDGVIVGTTGHSQDCQTVLQSLSSYLPICLAPNFSKGIFLLGALLSAQIEKNENFSVLARKNGFQISLRDTHHQYKKDAPSGTALWLNQWLSVPKTSIESIRTGEVVGEHSIFFTAQNETIELSHKVISRDVFADGACDLSIHFFEKNLSSGMYSVSDIWA